MTPRFAFRYLSSIRRPLMFGAAAIALSAMCLGGAVAMAATPKQAKMVVEKGNASTAAKLKADEYKESELLQSLRLIGNVSLTYKGWRLEAHQIGYNHRTGRIVASGSGQTGAGSEGMHVRITRPDNQVIEQKAYIVDGVLREGFFAALVSVAGPGSFAETVLNPDVVEESAEQVLDLTTSEEVAETSQNVRLATSDLTSDERDDDSAAVLDNVPVPSASLAQSLLEAPEAPAGGQDVKVVDEAYFPLSADYYAEYGVLNRLRLKGDVIINYNDWAMRADQLSYDIKKDQITVSGNVKVKQPDGRILSQYARVLEGELRNGFFYGLRQFAEPGTLAFDIIQEHDAKKPDKVVAAPELHEFAVKDPQDTLERKGVFEKPEITTYVKEKSKAAQAFGGAKIIKADKYSETEIFKNIRFEGNVKIEYSGWRLWADKLTYNANKNRLTALGNVSVKSPDGEVSDSHAYVVEGMLREGFFAGLYRYAKPNSFAQNVLSQDQELLKSSGMMVAAVAPDVSKDGTIAAVNAESVLGAKGKQIETLKGVILVSDPNLVEESFLVDAMVNYVISDRQTTPIMTYGFDFQDYKFDRTLDDNFIERPITMGLLDNLVKEIKERNREKGWPFTTVYVPEQTVQDGVVFLVAQRAVMDEITVSGNKYYTDGQILSQIRQKTNRPIKSKRWSEDLEWLNKSSYRAVTARFEPGTALGSTKADIHVSDVKPWRVYVTRSNNGTPTLGEQLTGVGLSHGNLWRKDHELSYQYLASRVNQNLIAHSGRYRFPLPWRHYLSFDASYSRSHARFLDDAFTSEGASRQFAGRYEIPLADNIGDRWSFKDQMVKLGLDYKHSEGNIFFSLFGGDPINIGADTSVEILQAAASYEGQIDDPLGGQNRLQAEAYLSPGGILGGNEGDDFDRARAGAASSYVYGRLALDRSIDMLMPFADDPFTLETDLRTQISSARLVGSEQFVTGGFAQIRGYHASAFSGDYGYSTSLEFNSPAFNVFPSDLNDALNVGAFVDFGTLGNLTPRDGEEKFNHLLTSGLELKYQINNNFIASFVYARDLAAQDQDDLQDLKFNVTLSY